MVNRKRLFVAISVMACLAIAIVIARNVVIGRHSHSQLYKSAQFLPVAKSLPNFSLTTSSANSRAFSSADFSNHWSLIFFGFTECSDVCPLTLQQLAALLRLSKKHSQ